MNLASFQQKLKMLINKEEIINNYEMGDTEYLKNTHALIKLSDVTIAVPLYNYPCLSKINDIEEDVQVELVQITHANDFLVYLFLPETVIFCSGLGQILKIDKYDLWERDWINKNPDEKNLNFYNLINTKF
jgi:hypothetical protein